MRQEPYPLPKDFEWVTVDMTNPAEVRAAAGALPTFDLFCVTMCSYQTMFSLHGEDSGPAVLPATSWYLSPPSSHSCCILRLAILWSATLVGPPMVISSILGDCCR